MRRSEFILPDTTRVKWVSVEAEMVWKPRFAQICSAWEQIERTRMSCLQVAKPDEIMDLSRWATNRGMYMLLLDRVMQSDMYSSETKPFVEGEPYVYRVGLTYTSQKFRDAWDQHDDRILGHILGYPDCCTAFFSKYWRDQKHLDTTWPQALETMGEEGFAERLELLPPTEERSVTINCSPGCNLLWRWVGVRPVSHLPCSFNCEGTRKVAAEFKRNALILGYEQEMDWMYQILKWPVEWSALHGYAEVKSPVCTIITRTDATPVKYTVRYAGTGYPEEGARGNKYPYRTSV